MGFWLSVGTMILFVSALLRLIVVIASFEKIIEFMILPAIVTPWISLIMYLLLPSHVLVPGVRHFLPFRHFLISLSRYPSLIAIVFIVLLLSAMLFQIRFRSPVSRFVLCATEPIIVITIVLLGSSFYLQYYVALLIDIVSDLRALPVWHALELVSYLPMDIILVLGSVIACFVVIVDFVIWPLWRSFAVIYVVTRPYMGLQMFHCRRHSRLLEPDRECKKLDLLLISDLHIAPNGTMHLNLRPDDMLSWLKGLVAATKPKAVLLCGDITDRGDRESWNMAAEFARSLGVPTLVIPGNHDVHFKRLAEKNDSDTWVRYFLEFVGEYFDRMGEGVASFAAEEVLTNIRSVSSVEVSGFPQLVQRPSMGVDILLLDSNRRQSSSAITNAIGHVGQDQLAAARRLISRRNTNDTPLLIALHHHVLPVLSPDTALLTCDDANEVIRFGLEVGAAAIVHGHTHMPDLIEYSHKTEKIFVFSCGSALFPAQGRRAKQIRFPSCFGLRLRGNAIDEKVGIFARM